MTESNIRPELADLTVPIGEVREYPGNPRKGNLTKIRTSLYEHGQYQPLLVQASTGRVVKGNNTLHVARDLMGWDSIAVKRLELDDKQARDILLIDNASSDDADYDKAALVAILGEVDDWDSTGFVPDDLDDLLAELSESAPETMAALAPAAVLEAVPATDARYAETPEQEDARREHAESLVPARARGLTEMVLAYELDDRAEAERLITAAKRFLGRDIKAPDVVLRALRVLVVIGDSDDFTPVSATALRRAAGMEAIAP